MKELSPTEQGEIQRVVRFVPGAAGERLFRDLTKTWPLDHFDYALERVQTDAHALHRPAIITLLKTLRDEKRHEELALRFSDRQIESMKKQAAGLKVPSSAMAGVEPATALGAQKQRGEAMLARLPIEADELAVWTNAGADIIGQIFGPELSQINVFIGDTPNPFNDPPTAAQEQATSERLLRRRVRVLEHLLINLPTPTPSSETRATPADSIPWTAMHPKVLAAAKKKFEDGHRADAVRAAFTDLNNKVKAALRQKNGEELDGAKLMSRAFGGDAPLFKLADLEEESGRNFQAGHTLMLMGVMTGIRNPPAHSTTELTADVAFGQLFVCSYLFGVVEPAFDSDSAS